jgi:hypothetical protein
MESTLTARLQLALLGLLLGCAANEAQPPSLNQAPTPSVPPVVVMPPAPLAADTDSVAKPDSAAPKSPPITVPSVPGRSRKDSLALVSAVRAGMDDKRWPVVGPEPWAGSILPARRIVAFYGNPLSKKMGILGELPPDQMLARLDREVAAWSRADTTRPVQPALHLIVVVAQGYAGRDGKYRLRMADSLVERVARWAAKRDGLLFLDIQVGKSTVQEEIPRLAQFLRRPDVHLALDPEFSMKSGDPPGKKIGTMSASDVNYAIRYLSDIVTKNDLPPKVLVVHRFTRNMLVGAKNIVLNPRVQVVIDMDGWGNPWLKYDSYRDYIAREPVQFTGFKLFYHNDTKKGAPLLTPAEVLRLTPQPLYIQYQ